MFALRWYSARAACVIVPKYPVGPIDASLTDAGPEPSTSRNVWSAQTSVPCDPKVSGRPLFDKASSSIPEDRRSVSREETLGEPWEIALLEMAVATAGPAIRGRMLSTIPAIRGQVECLSSDDFIFVGNGCFKATY